MSFWDVLKYDIIGLSTPEQKEYLLKIQSQQNAQKDYWRTRDCAVIRVWYVKELKKHNFFDNPWQYTRRPWTVKDLFDFEEYGCWNDKELFFDTVYQVIYSKLLAKIGDKMNALEIHENLTRETTLLGFDFYKDKMFDDIKQYFEIGKTIDWIVEYFSSFENYKDYKLHGAEDSSLSSVFKREFLNPLYEEYDEQMKLLREFKKSPLAKQLYEQNQLLKKKLDLEDPEPEFSFTDNVKNR